MKKSNVKALLMTTLLYSTYSYSACIQNPNLRNINVNVPTQTHTIQYDDNSTRNLGSYTIRFASDNITTFSGKDGQCGQARLHASYINGWVPNLNKIAATNIPGISVEIRAMGAGSLNYYSSYPIGDRMPWRIEVPKWVFIVKKTGNVTQSNTLKAGAVARLVQENPNHINWNISTLNIPMNAVRINVAKCTTKSNNYTVVLGDWYDTQFKDIGAVSASVNIPITLSCAAGTNIKTTITSSAGYVDTQTGKIKLSGTGSATGIAIQLLNASNAPIKLATKNNTITNSAAGDIRFNWKARYIKTAAKITPGKANSTATVNIRYE
ncbi:TPA: fimbrial protein [Providencia rettgeri]|uniref:fimbrial protein n=1 Tax=Providencia TaxID=586 RepID=UPI0008FAEC6D|nr:MULTISPECIES: fimbrial protein [Providencia]APC10005.1 Type-1 fimbrial protein, A chain precursor [Providencia rettgeri]AVL73650.1 type 1 fimbrial protein [Providencia rettgeri]EJD6539997.1 fimbrial protein [Providencia rettgeri]EJD6671883.1 fimbrial protein [Providencia rettgeri]EKH6497291.1 fimbrial protein [Providencia rettgeri]